MILYTTKIIVYETLKILFFIDTLSYFYIEKVLMYQQWNDHDQRYHNAIVIITDCYYDFTGLHW